MRITFVVPNLDVHGGLMLAGRRMAEALQAHGHRCEFLCPQGMGLPPHWRRTVNVRQCEHLPLQPSGSVERPGALKRTLADGEPDLIVVPIPNLGVLRSATEVARTVLHSQMSWAACPDSTRYWYRVKRPCTVVAGGKCLALRPVLGCESRRRVSSPRPVWQWHELTNLLNRRELGTVAISGPQAELLIAQGHPPERITVVPNLGLRFSSEQVHAAADAVPEQDRSTVMYFGRLTKEKGAAHLRSIADTIGTDHVRVFGDGYGKAAFKGAASTVLRGSVSQTEVAGLLSWARAVVFPARWPEPGGIVGIDAQLCGAPLACFEVGAPMDWPNAARFRLSDESEMVEWLRERPRVQEARDADVIASRQSSYWRRVGKRASVALEGFVRTGEFPALNKRAVRDDLVGALGIQSATETAAQ